MKKLTKLFAVFSTAAVIASGCFATVSADTPPEGYDINGDGLVNVADAVYVSSFFQGRINPIDKTAFDVNGNGIVTIVDQRIIMLYIAGVNVN